MSIKFFAAIKLADFATELLSIAGFDLAKLAEAGDAKALNEAIAQKIAAARPSDEFDEALVEAAQENELLTKRVLSLENAILNAGVKLQPLAADAKPEEIAARETAITDELKARASVLAQEMLAAAGHPPIDDPVIDPSKVSKPTNTGLTGLARVQAAFAAARK